MKQNVRRIIFNSFHVIITLMIMFTFFISLMFLVLNIAYSSTYVYGMSMYPTLNKNVASSEERGDLVLISRFGEAKVKDIIIAKPSWSNKTVIKRLIGTPGDTIKILKTDKYELYSNDNLVYSKDINPRTTNYYQKYLDSLALLGDDHITLNDDEYFIMGDNWGDSSDSITNNLKTISKSMLVGKVDLVVDKNENRFFAITKFCLNGIFSF